MQQRSVKSWRHWNGALLKQHEEVEAPGADGVGAVYYCIYATLGILMLWR